MRVYKIILPEVKVIGLFKKKIIFTIVAMCKKSVETDSSSPDRGWGPKVKSKIIH